MKDIMYMAATAILMGVLLGGIVVGGMWLERWKHTPLECKCP